MSKFKVKKEDTNTYIVERKTNEKTFWSAFSGDMAKDRAASVYIGWKKMSDTIDIRFYKAKKMSVSQV